MCTCIMYNASPSISSLLAGMTKGRAQYTMQLERYEPVPNSIQEKIVEGHKTTA